MIENIYRKRIYHNIEEEYVNYKAIYYPNNYLKHNFASLHIILNKKLNENVIEEILINEFEKWIEKYEVPILLTVFDEFENKLYFESLDHESEITGHLVGDRVEWKWGVMSSSKFSDKYFQSELIDQIYEGLDYKSIEDKSAEIEINLSERKSIARVFKAYAIGYLIVSIVIAVLGFQSPVVGFTACMYSIYMAFKSYNKSRNRLTSREEKEKEVNAKMKHYYYHCELNQEAFQKLKADNFKNNRC